MGAGQQLRTMKGGVVTKLRLIVILPCILVLWVDKGTLAGSVPQRNDNSQFPKFLVLDKPGGKKSLIEIEGKTGRKESIKKQTDHDYSDVKCSFEGKEYMPGVTRYCDCTFCKCLETGDWKPTTTTTTTYYTTPTTTTYYEKDKYPSKEPHYDIKFDYLAHTTVQPPVVYHTTEPPKYEPPKYEPPKYEPPKMEHKYEPPSYETHGPVYETPHYETPTTSKYAPTTTYYEPTYTTTEEPHKPTYTEPTTPEPYESTYKIEPYSPDYKSAPAADAPKPAPEAPKPASEAPAPAPEAPKPAPEAPKPAPEAPKHPY